MRDRGGGQRGREGEREETESLSPPPVRVSLHFEVHVGDGI